MKRNQRQAWKGRGCAKSIASGIAAAVCVLVLLSALLALFVDKGIVGIERIHTGACLVLAVGMFAGCSVTAVMSRKRLAPCTAAVWGTVLTLFAAVGYLLNGSLSINPVSILISTAAMLCSILLAAKRKQHY